MWTYTLLPKILNMSLTASIVIVLVLLARVPLKKAPKIFSYALWVVVLFRLVCPVSFSSEFSMLGLFNAPPATNGTVAYIPADIVHTEYPQVDLPLPAVSEAINNNLLQGEEQLVADPLEGLVSMATLLWLLGIAVMLIYSMVSLMQLRRKLIGAVYLRDNIYLADHIPTPFVIGLFHPKIYLPSTISEEEQSYIILHEQTHIRRLDHIVKMIAFLALAIHWFNPLVWVAFVCAVKDMEMSCDERVLKQMGGEIKGAYSTSLLSLATGRRLINGSPLAFGEGNIKGRIKNVMNFKKPEAWVIAVSVVLVATLTVGFAVNQADGKILTAQAALDAFSAENKDGRVTFVIPRDYDKPQNWNIIVAGRAEYEDGFSRSVHLFEDVNEAKTWVAGKKYTIEIDDSYTELHITVSLPDENGKILVRDFDFDFTQDASADVSSLVENFGKTLKMVSLTAPEEIAAKSIEENYSEYVTKELLAQWQSNPQNAPGRRLSSPWPERIEVTNVIPTNDGGYTVFATIIEVTSTELQTGGAAAKRPIMLTVIKVNDRWLISDVVVDSIADNASGEKWTLITEADVTGDGIKEAFYLDKSQIDVTFDLTLRILDSAGNEIWSESGNSSHAGWESLFLCTLDGKEYILRYTPHMGQGYCTYKYTLFTLEDGKEKVFRTNTLEFDINGTKELDVPEMIAYADEINDLLGESVLLMSTEGGVYSFGPASAESFFERYSWLDGSPALFNHADSLETKLEKYSNWVVKNRRLSDLLYNANFTIVPSDKFSEAEIRDAMYCVMDKFEDAFKGCELTKLWYDEEKSNSQIESYMSGGHGSFNGVSKDNVIVLLSEFDVDSSGGDGSLNPNSTYNNWMWILIRDSSKGEWQVDDWGY